MNIKKETSWYSVDERSYNNLIMCKSESIKTSLGPIILIYILKLCTLRISEFKLYNS